MNIQKITKEVIENLPINKNYVVFGRDKIILELIYLDTNSNIYCQSYPNETISIDYYIDSFKKIDDDYKAEDCYIVPASEVTLPKHLSGCFACGGNPDHEPRCPELY